MNKLLQRQIKKIYGELNNPPAELSRFLDVISDAYDGFDRDRKLTERSLEISSQELFEVNDRLRQESQRQKEIVEDLRKATEILRPEGYIHPNSISSKEEAAELARSLSKLIELEKQYEEDLLRSRAEAETEKAKAEAILKSIGDGVFAVDMDYKIILMNPIAERLSEYSFEEAQGKYYKDIFKFVKEKDPEQEYPPFIEHVIATGEIRELENHTLLITKNKKEIPIADSAAPIKDNKGNILGCIITIRNVSKERQLEKSKDEFISVAAHQLRTPLGSTRWNLEMILNEPDLPTKVKEKVNLIYQSNQRLTSLVNDLLNVSSIDQGTMRDVAHPTNIVEIITSLIKELEAEANEKNISIEFDSANDIPIINIDPERFREVIQNLLSNAIKYSFVDGKIKVKLENENNGIKISVTDNGMGIPEADRPQVFTKFYRAANAIKSHTSGTGLGLFVVKSYVDRWGGKVSFDTAESKGTTFMIELPIKSN